MSVLVHGNAASDSLPEGDAETRQALDLYKIMVESSEGLVSHRQGVNTFFLTMNGALLTASGIIVQSSGGDRLGGLGVAMLAVAGQFFAQRGETKIFLHRKATPLLQCLFAILISEQREWLSQRRQQSTVERLNSFFISSPR